MGNYRPFLQGPLPVANYSRIIIPGRFWTRPPSTKSTRMASSATPLHDSLIELAIPDAHAHAIKWYLNEVLGVTASILINSAEWCYCSIVVHGRQPTIKNSMIFRSTLWSNYNILQPRKKNGLLCTSGKGSLGTFRKRLQFLVLV